MIHESGYDDGIVWFVRTCHQRGNTEAEESTEGGCRQVPSAVTVE